MMPIRWILGLAASIGALAVSPALAQRTIDFEDLAPGTIVTGQYPGVAFSTVGSSCGGSPAIRMTIQSPATGAYSGSRALGITTGCPDFSPDYLRIVFASPQSDVSFALRSAGGSAFAIRSYDEAGTLLAGPALTFNVAPSGPVGAFRLIAVSSASGQVKRIEVESVISDYEVIDELAYQADTTPPEVDILSPSLNSCLAPNAPFDLFGRVCDPDGEYVGDALEYRHADAVPSTPWISLGAFSGSVCEGGVLYDQVLLPAGLSGDVLLRLTGRNLDGLQSSATTVVHLDAAMPTVDLRFPLAGQVVRAGVCFEGTVSDRCAINYTVSYRPGAVGAFLPVQPAIPTYTGAVINDPVIPSPYWNTSPLPDGVYQVRVVADDTNGNTTTTLRNIVVDNTPPAAAITSPLPCRFICGAIPITGSVSDANLASWTLQYTGGNAAGWVTIASGTNNTSGTLGVWNTAGLPTCAYTLRLVATDRADPGCGRPGGNATERTVSINLGPAGDFNRDLAVNSLDISTFLTAWLRGVAGGCE